MKMWKVVTVGVVAVVMALALGAVSSVYAADCQFVLGFAALHNQIPAVVGQCTGNEYHDGVGNGYQNTVNGTLAWRKADNWTAFTNGYQTWVSGPYGVRQRLNTQRFPWEANREGLPILNDGTTNPLPNVYYDDRSNAETLMLSWVNALNQRQYLRAYSYWEPNAAQLPSFDQFQQGYANTATTQITLGQIQEGAAAGNYYNSVPVVLTAQLRNGTMQTFVGCYRLHLASPALQGPPFQSLGIQSAVVETVAPGVDPGPRLATICPAAGSPMPPQPPADPTDISAGRYLDDRTNPVQVLRSLFNAVNRREYSRAYGYWEANAVGLPSFDQFQQGYAATQSVQLTTGTVSGDVGAGQTYYKVPVTLTAQTTGGPQTFVGCYQLHLSSPFAQATPPYRGIGVRAGSLRQVANNANTAALMAQACQGVP